MNFWSQSRKMHFLVACGLVLLVNHGVHKASVIPLRKKEAQLTGSLPDLKKRNQNVQRTIGEIEGMKREAGFVRSEITRLEREVEAGGAVVWLPPLVREHFSRFGISGPASSVKTVRDDPENPGFERSLWHVRVPVDPESRNIPALLRAIADLDQRNSFVRVADFMIREDWNDATQRVAVLNLDILSPKAKNSR
jgi:hypothetical protein